MRLGSRQRTNHDGTPYFFSSVSFTANREFKQERLLCIFERMLWLLYEELLWKGKSVSRDIDLKHIAGKKQWCKVATF